MHFNMYVVFSAIFIVMILLRVGSYFLKPLKVIQTPQVGIPMNIVAIVLMAIGGFYIPAAIMTYFTMIDAIDFVRYWRTREVIKILEAHK